MADVQINVSWIARGSQDFSSERVWRQFPDAPKTDEVTEWQNWLKGLGIIDRFKLLELCDPNDTINDPDTEITLDDAEAFEF